MIEAWSLLSPRREKDLWIWHRIPSIKIISIGRRAGQTAQAVTSAQTIFFRALKTHSKTWRRWEFARDCEYFHTMEDTGFYSSGKSFLSLFLSLARARAREHFLCSLTSRILRQQRQPYLARLFLLPSRHSFFCSALKLSIVFMFGIAAVVLGAFMFLRRRRKVFAHALF